MCEPSSPIEQPPDRALPDWSPAIPDSAPLAHGLDLLAGELAAIIHGGVIGHESRNRGAARAFNIHHRLGSIEDAVIEVLELSGGCIVVVSIHIEADHLGRGDLGALALLEGLAQSDAGELVLDPDRIQVTGLFLPVELQGAAVALNGAMSTQHGPSGAELCIGKVGCADPDDPVFHLPGAHDAVVVLPAIFVNHDLTVKRGGYRHDAQYIDYLVDQLEKILHVDHEWEIVYYCSGRQLGHFKSNFFKDRSSISYPLDFTNEFYSHLGWKLSSPCVRFDIKLGF